MHLIAKAINCDTFQLSDQLQNPWSTYDFLNKAVRQANMTKITPPIVTEYGVPGYDWGVSGFVMIAESHISVHTFVENRAAFIDVFSCKEFDAEGMLKVVQDCYRPAKIEHQIVERGLVLLMKDQKCLITKK